MYFLFRIRFGGGGGGGGCSTSKRFVITIQISFCYDNKLNSESALRWLKIVYKLCRCNCVRTVYYLLDGSQNELYGLKRIYFICTIYRKSLWIVNCSRQRVARKSQTYYNDRLRPPSNGDFYRSLSVRDRVSCGYLKASWRNLNTKVKFYCDRNTILSPRGRTMFLRRRKTFLIGFGADKKLPPPLPTLLTRWLFDD